MTTDNPENVVMVLVKRYDVTVTLEQILEPLARTASQLTQAGQTQPEFKTALDPEIAPHLQAFTDLVGQLKDVVGRINAADPNLLASKPGPPPGA